MLNVLSKVYSGKVSEIAPSKKIFEKYSENLKFSLKCQCVKIQDFFTYCHASTMRQKLCVTFESEFNTILPACVISKPPLSMAYPHHLQSGIESDILFVYQRRQYLEVGSRQVIVDKHR